MHGTGKPSSGAKKTVPTEPSAAKLKNHLIQNYGGESKKLYSSSNPYAEHQFLEAYVPKDKMVQLEKDLGEQGWTLNQSNIREKYHLTVRQYEHISGAGLRLDKRDGTVEIRGLKKAKRMTVPYYD